MQKSAALNSKLTFIFILMNRYLTVAVRDQQLIRNRKQYRYDQKYQIYYKYRYKVHRIPPSNIISRAEELNTPLLLVGADTYEAAKQTDRIEALLTEESEENIHILTDLVKENLDSKKLFD